MDSNDGCPEEASRSGGPSGRLGPGEGLGIFPFGHRDQGHILGTQREGSGDGQEPVSLFLALPMPIAPEGM